MAPELYNATTVQSHVGVPYHMLKDWTNKGILKPAKKQEGRGTGYARAYSFADLVAFAIAKRLKEISVSAGAMKSVLREVQSLPELQSAEDGLRCRRWLIWSGKKMWVSEDWSVDEIGNPGRWWFEKLQVFIPLGKIVGALVLRITLSGFDKAEHWQRVQEFSKAQDNVVSRIARELVEARKTHGDFDPMDALLGAFD